MSKPTCRYRHSFYRTLSGRVLCQWCGYEDSTSDSTVTVVNVDTSTAHAYLRRGAHDTEREAALAAYETSAATRARVYRFIRDRGEAGACDHEVEAALGLRVQTVTPRRLELVELGLVVKTDGRRLTPRGRSAIVWKAAQ
jgi:hypothetical protein